MTHVADIRAIPSRDIIGASDRAIQLEPENSIHYIHANLSALEAVIADIGAIGVDLVVHGGDLVSGGRRPADVIDRVRELRWPGVYGNTDEMLETFVNLGLR